MRKEGGAMKRLLLLGVGSALMFTMGGVGPAIADNGPHVSGSAIGTTSGAVVNVTNGAGKCAACHRAHTAQSEYLLIEAEPGLCNTCHDGSSAQTMVQDGIMGNGTGALRGGGFTTAAIDTGGARSTWTLSTATPPVLTRSNPTIPSLTATTGPAPVTSKHQIGVAGTAWGNETTATQGLGKSITLECTSCHDPHGNRNFRILRGQPTDAGIKGVTYRAPVAATPMVTNADGTITPATPGSPERAFVADTRPLAVNIPDEAGTAREYTTGNYWATGAATVPLNATPFTGAPSTGTAAPDGYIQNVAAWCTTCHTRYLAGSGSYKTASPDATYKFRHRSDANYKQNAANCITCHVSHGSNAVMEGSNYGRADVVKDPSGSPSASSRLLRVNNRGTCEMCHNV